MGLPTRSKGAEGGITNATTARENKLTNRGDARVRSRDGGIVGAAGGETELRIAFLQRAIRDRGSWKSREGVRHVYRGFSRAEEQRTSGRRPFLGPRPTLVSGRSGRTLTRTLTWARVVYKIYDQQLFDLSRFSAYLVSIRTRGKVFQEHPPSTEWCTTS